MEAAAALHPALHVQLLITSNHLLILLPNVKVPVRFDMWEMTQPENEMNVTVTVSSVAV